MSGRKIVQVYEGWSWQILLCAGENQTKSMGKYARCSQVGLLSFSTRRLAEEAMGMYYDLGYEPVRCYGKPEEYKWDPKKDKREKSVCVYDNDLGIDVSTVGDPCICVGGHSCESPDW